MDPWTGPRAGDGRWLLVRPEPVQPRDPSLPAAGLLVQAAGLFGGGWTMATRPSTVVVDAADRNRSGAGRRRLASGKTIRPGKYQGPVTLLRNALRQSLNNRGRCGWRRTSGMPLIGEYARRFGVYDELPNYLSYALGAGETTVMAHGSRPIRCSPMAGRPREADFDRSHPGPLRPHDLQA